MDSRQESRLHVINKNVAAAKEMDRSYRLLMGASPQTPTAASRTLPSLPIREAGGTPNGRGSSIRAVARSLRSRQKPRDPAMNLSCWVSECCAAQAFSCLVQLLRYIFITIDAGAHSTVYTVQPETALCNSVHWHTPF